MQRTANTNFAQKVGAEKANAMFDNKERVRKKLTLFIA
jgi:hypothetical protein